MMRFDHRPLETALRSACTNLIAPSRAGRDADHKSGGRATSYPLWGRGNQRLLTSCALGSGRATLCHIGRETGTIFPIYRHHILRRLPLGMRDWELGSCNHPPTRTRRPPPESADLYPYLRLDTGGAFLQPRRGGIAKPRPPAWVKSSVLTFSSPERA